MNRFDNGSVSAYTPQSMQELAFTPLMKRAKHDEMSKNLAELDAIATDPLDKHQAEALRIKQEFEGKIGNLSGDLAARGIDSIGVGDFYKLKKEHDDLIAPTGRIGQINNSKILYNKREEDYIKSAEKENIGRDQALINWKEVNKNYTGFSENGKDIKDVGELGANQFQDYDKQLALKHSLLGETIKGISVQGHHLEKGKDGEYWEVNKNGERIKSNNAIQVSNARKAFKDSWLYGEGAKWAKEAASGVDENRIDNDFNSMLKNSDVYKETVSANYHEPKSLDDGSKNRQSSLYGDPFDTQTIGGDKQDFSEIEKIGNQISSNTNLPTKDEFGVFDKTANDINIYNRTHKGQSWKSTDIKDPIQKALYDRAWKDATTGRGITLTNGKIGHLTKESIALGKDNPTVRKRLLDHLKLTPSETFHDKIIKTDQQYKDNGFPGYANKDQTDRDKQVQNDLKIGGTEGRRIIVNGKPVDLNKFLSDNDANLEDITFSGIKSFDRIESKNDVTGSNGSKSSPLMITVKTKNNQYLPFTTTRIASDNQGINPLRMDDIQKNKLKIMLNRDEFQDFKSNSKSLNGLKIRRNVNENINYDPETGELLEYTVRDKNGKDHYYTSDEYLTNMLATK